MISRVTAPADGKNRLKAVHEGEPLSGKSRPGSGAAAGLPTAHAADIPETCWRWKQEKKVLALGEKRRLILGIFREPETRVTLLHAGRVPRVSGS